MSDIIVNLLDKNVRFTLKKSWQEISYSYNIQDGLYSFRCLLDKRLHFTAYYKNLCIIKRGPQSNYWYVFDETPNQNRHISLSSNDFYTDCGSIQRTDKFLRQTKIDEDSNFCDSVKQNSLLIAQKCISFNIDLFNAIIDKDNFTNQLSGFISVNYPSISDTDNYSWSTIYFNNFILSENDCLKFKQLYTPKYFIDRFDVLKKFNVSENEIKEIIDNYLDDIKSINYTKDFLIPVNDNNFDWVDCYFETNTIDKSLKGTIWCSELDILNDIISLNSDKLTEKYNSIDYIVQQLDDLPINERQTIANNIYHHINNGLFLMENDIKNEIEQQITSTLNSYKQFLKENENFIKANNGNELNFSLSASDINNYDENTRQIINETLAKYHESIYRKNSSFLKPTFKNFELYMKYIKELVQELINLNILTESENAITLNPENYENIINIDEKFLDFKEYRRTQKL